MNGTSARQAAHAEYRPSEAKARIEARMTMTEAYICDSIRTPIGRYGGALAHVRGDDLAAIPIKALIDRNPGVDWSELDDVILGCANQAGEDNRNLARMAGLLAGLPDSSGGVTLNRLCGSGLDAVAMSARAIRGGESDLIIAGGSESMSRAPFVMAKAETAFSRNAEIYDTTIGWRFVNPRMRDAYGDDTMPSTAENVAQEFQVSRDDQDAFAMRSQQKTAAAQASGRLAAEIVPVEIPQRKGDPLVVDTDEHPRLTSIDKLAALKPIVRKDGTVTAGNASGVNDGAAALIVASEEAAKRNGLTPRARILGGAVAGVPPRIMGIGPAPATEKLLKRLGLSLDQLDVIELNEAFAAQGLAVLRQLGLSDDDPRVNPNGGAIALGHPLGMSGARLALTATEELHRGGGKYALATMCIGVGQGIALALERV
jgi:3-oxoadipyl-CoA thiolase